MSDVLHIGLQHLGRLAAFDLVLFKFEKAVDRAREEKVRAVWSAIARRFFEHHADNFAEVEDVVELALGSLKFVHASELMASLLDTFLNQS